MIIDPSRTENRWKTILLSTVFERFSPALTEKKLNSTLNLLLSLSPSFRLSSFLPSSTFQRWWKVAMVDGWRGWEAESGGNLIARAYQTCQRHKRRGYRHACNFQHKGGRSLARGPISMETSQADVHSLY